MTTEKTGGGSRNEPASVNYTQFACIGAGFSAICLGATLQRWYGITDIRFFERHDRLGGTWLVNRYPGCACDVPSALYSYSFSLNPDWTELLSPAAEIWHYLQRVADEYSLTPKMTFRSSVERCEWLEDVGRWRLRVRNLDDDAVSIHEARFLFSGAGQLVEPQDLDVPGAETFKGPIFHSSRWRDDVRLDGKNVVVFGNGCTAAQLVPSIAERTKHLTQVVRAKHWIFPSPMPESRPELLERALRHFPSLTMPLERFAIFCLAENGLRVFPMTEAGAKFRRGRRQIAEKYIRETAPEKYHDMLIPDYEVGCKRRIYDSKGYLDCLNAENVTLTDEPVVEIVPEGVRAADGTIIEADVIVLANGFKTNEFFAGIEVIGRGGETVQEHWDEFGGAEAYNCSVMSGFPNLFMLLGPNAATGHTSAIMAAENSVNYALRVLKPVLEGGNASVAELRPEAEREYVDRLQADLGKTVWSSGCQSWYVKETGADGGAGGGKKWNAMSYPYSQAYFWYRSLFPKWGDWVFYGTPTTSIVEKPQFPTKRAVALMFSVGLGLGLLLR